MLAFGVLGQRLRLWESWLQPTTILHLGSISHCWGLRCTHGTSRPSCSHLPQILEEKALGTFHGDQQADLGLFGRELGWGGVRDPVPPDVV